MLVVYASLTGNVEDFVNRLDAKVCHIDEYHKGLGKFVLVTYTTGRGLVPKEVTDFLKLNAENMVGVVGSGNRIWGLDFARSADTISHEHDVPVLLKIQLRGTDKDRETLIERMNNLAELHRAK